MKYKILKDIKFWVVIVAVILPLVVLYFDFQVYLTYITRRSPSEEEIERVFLLNTPLIQKISQELETKKEFLKSLKYPLLKEPF